MSVSALLFEIGRDSGQRKASDRDRAERDKNPDQERRLNHKEQDRAGDHGKDEGDDRKRDTDPAQLLHRYPLRLRLG